MNIRFCEFYDALPLLLGPLEKYFLNQNQQRSALLPVTYLQPTMAPLSVHFQVQKRLCLHCQADQALVVYTRQTIEKYY